MKKITGILAVLAIGFIFVGCGAKEEAAAPTDTPKVDGAGGAGGDASKANPDTPK